MATSRSEDLIEKLRSASGFYAVPTYENDRTYLSIHELANHAADEIQRGIEFQKQLETLQAKIWDLLEDYTLSENALRKAIREALQGDLS